MMDCLSVDEMKREMMFDLQIPFAGIGSEILLRKDGIYFGFGSDHHNAGMEYHRFGRIRFSYCFLALLVLHAGVV